MAATEVSPSKLALIKEYVSEIAATCDVVRELAAEVVATGHQDTGALGGSIRELAAKAGLLADESSRLMGGTPMCGSWPEWFLSPVAIEAHEKVNAEEGARRG